MKKIFPASIIICAALLLAAAITVQKVASAPQTESAMDYSVYTDALDLIEIVEASELDADVLQTRNGKLIIERCIGIVDNAETGDGHVLNEDPNCNYISYRGVPGVLTGNVVCTYFIYNPDTNYIDDILLRFDYIIDSRTTEN